MTLSKQFSANQASDENIDIHNLVVWDFKTQSGARPAETQQAIEEWREKHSPLYTMSCARQIWYGAASDFTDFPDLDNDHASTRLEGAEAYAHLASFATGFEGKTCDTHNRNQFIRAWKDMQRTTPEKSRRAEDLMKALDYDAKTVTSKITGHLRTADRMSVAADLSQQKKGKQSLIITQTTKGENLTDPCLRLIAAIEKINRHTSHHDNYIRMTAPNDAELDLVEKAVKHARSQASIKKHNIRSNIQFLKLEDALASVDEADCVYVDAPMDQHPDMDRLIHDTWKHRDTSGATLTHVKGKPENRGLSSPTWTEAGLDNYKATEDINAGVQERKVLAECVWKKSHQAFQTIAELRAQNITPSRSVLQKTNDNVFNLDLT